MCSNLFVSKCQVMLIFFCFKAVGGICFVEVFVYWRLLCTKVSALLGPLPLNTSSHDDLPRTGLQICAAQQENSAHDCCTEFIPSSEYETRQMWSFYFSSRLSTTRLLSRYFTSFDRRLDFSLWSVNLCPSERNGKTVAFFCLGYRKLNRQ